MADSLAEFYRLNDNEKMPYSTKHIIQQPKPYRTLLIIIAVAIITYAVQWVFIQDDIQQQRQHREQRQKKLASLHKKLNHLTIENEHLIQGGKLSAQTQANLAVEQATIKQLRIQIKKLQQQVLTLNKELLFYQSITQGNRSNKLQFRELDLRANDEHADIINYRLVITQGRKITKPITGTINIIFNKSPNDKIEHHLNLRYVQVIEGQIKLMDNVVPASITVSLVQKNKTTLSKTFDWQLNSKP